MDFKVSSYSEKQNLKLKENQRMFRIFQAKKYRTDSNTLVTILQIFERTQKVFLQINTPVTAFLVMQAVFRSPWRKLIQRLLKGTSWAGTLQKSTGLHNGISGDLFQKSSLGLDSPRSTGAMPRLVTTWATKYRLLAHVLDWKRNKRITKYSCGSFPYFLQSYDALRMVGKSNSFTLIPGLQNQ